MSALAMFGLKYVSLLSFDRDVRSEAHSVEPEDPVRGVAGTVGHSDGERLDQLDPAALRVAFKRVIRGLATR